jgi:hypothetical protein
MKYDAKIETYTTVEENGSVHPTIEYDKQVFFSNSYDDAIDFAHTTALFDAKIKYINDSGEKDPELGIYISAPDNRLKENIGNIDIMMKYEKNVGMKISDLEKDIRERRS